MEKTKKNILICDDEADILTVYNRMLSNLYNVETSSSGEDCLNKYMKAKSEGRKVDLVITDLRMPGMNGYELAKNIREVDNQQKILLVTAHDVDMKWRGEYVKSFIDDYVTKPLRTKNFEEKVAMLIGR